LTIKSRSGLKLNDFSAPSTSKFAHFHYSISEMKSTLLALTALIPVAFGQAPNATYLTGLAQALNASGLTQLATGVSGINNTALGQRLLAALPNKNWTVFAPNDAACAFAPITP
jgi:hypothetical protein